MKVAVMNFSGNVGKSTVARYLIAPRLDDARLFSIETINAGENPNGNAFRGQQFGALQETLSVEDDAVVDVGSSNVEEFVKLMELYRGSHEDFDCFVIPTVPAEKQQMDTVSTLRALTRMGVEPPRLRLLFNMVDPRDDLGRTFELLFDFHGEGETFWLRRDAAIHFNELFSKLKEVPGGIEELLEDRTDYKEWIRSSTEPADKRRFMQRLALIRLARGVGPELDQVFDSLLGESLTEGAGDEGK